MVYAGNESDEYLPDSDDSHDEADERPNRWTGPPSTWQQLNSAEIDTLTALNEIRNRDLSVHLYNAFALKRRHVKNKKKTRDVTKTAPLQDVDAGAGQSVPEDKWVPPNAWTAWPLPASVVPQPDFMKPIDAADAHSTYRMRAQHTLKTELEETISASILRSAKEKFQARQAAQKKENADESGLESSDEGGSGVEMSSTPLGTTPKSRARTVSNSRKTNHESTSDREMMDADDPPATAPSSSSILPERVRLQTVIATDDELSYSLLRPSAQGILAQLDAALTILHHAEESRTHCPSESEVSDASSHSQSRSRSLSRGPTNSHSQSPEARRERPLNATTTPIAEEPAPLETPAVMKKLGRPKKAYPHLDGETERAYAVRIARLRKKPIPRFVDDDAEPASDSTPAPNLASKHTNSNTRGKSKTQKARPQSRPRQRSPTALSEVASAGEPKEKIFRKPRMARARLRDWRDILGAAALAGFPAAALDRAARRCADLFGQSFTLHTLQEGPLDQDADKYVCYRPGMPIPRLLDDSEDDANEGPSRPASPEGEQRSRGRSVNVATRGKSQAKSAPRSDGLFCMVSDCPRAVEPFTRRLNLLRHLRLVHMYDGDELPVEVDSGDEMHGAVHVDGFLRPIKMRPGWRRDGEAREKKKPRKRVSKARVEEVDDTRMQADSGPGREVSD
ncbi:RNA polymerase I-specific transcription initiation factor-domain-containing protein [Hypoxylon argillaceum]|nr:RNA polymerase I-specific transcription initiation factor-domain-containing protein [Hypoxylon argillaceum]